MLDIQIDHAASRPTNVQLVEYIRSRIVTGQLAAGDRLPTTQEIVRQARVSARTVRQAMNQLEQEGLVEATPGRGTFVRSGAERYLAAEEQRSTALRQIGILLSDMDRPDTISGIMKECNRQRVVPEIYAEQWVQETPLHFNAKLRGVGVDGLVWFPGNNYNVSDVFKELPQVPMVVVSRTHLDHGFACIEGDFEAAGFTAGQHFLEQGCEGVTLLGDPKPATSCREPRLMADVRITQSLRQGLLRAFDFHNDSVEMVVVSEEQSRAEEEVAAALAGADRRRGLLFGNGYCFADYLKRQEAAYLLKERQYVVVSNRTCSLGMLPSVLKLGLSFMVLADRFEQNARMAIQKLTSLLDGNLNNTKTLIQLNFQSFDELDLRTQAS